MVDTELDPTEFAKSADDLHSGSKADLLTGNDTINGSSPIKDINLPSEAGDDFALEYLELIQVLDTRTPTFVTNSMMNTIKENDGDLPKGMMIYNYDEEAMWFTDSGGNLTEIKTGTDFDEEGLIVPNSFV